MPAYAPWHSRLLARRDAQPFGRGSTCELLRCGEMWNRVSDGNYVKHSRERSNYMSHAVVINVELPTGGAPEDGLKMLNELVIPQAKSQQGFQNGTWMNDHGKGMGVVVFDTEDNANAAQKNLRPPEGTPTKFLSSSVYEVGAQAQA